MYRILKKAIEINECRAYRLSYLILSRNPPPVHAAAKRY